MVEAPLQLPVAFIVFNRPDLTKITFEAIRQARPARLLVIADGPRTEEEAEKCRNVRDIIDGVDWECEVSKNYSDVNLGCRNRVSSGIDWVFNNVEEALILEDDCFPDLSFFYFCQTMIERYRQDQTVMHISGVNFQNGVSRGPGNYYFSKYPHIWGWATWRRAWQNYDVKMATWPEFSLSSQFKDWCESEDEMGFWKDILQRVYEGKVDTWDYQWVYSVMKNNGLCLMPNQNLISNIGFRADATHTQHENAFFSSMERSAYVMPDTQVQATRDQEADHYTYNFVLHPRAPLQAAQATRFKASRVRLRGALGKFKRLITGQN